MNKLLNKLNGWQRLWLVLSVLYLIAVGIFTVSVIPTASDYQTDRIYDTFNLIRDINPKAFDTDWTYIIRERAKEMGDDAWVNQVHNQYGNKIFHLIEQEYQNKLSALHTEQLKIVGGGLVFGTLPIIIIYVLGLSFGWVFKGFRNKSPQ